MGDGFNKWDAATLEQLEQDLRSAADEMKEQLDDLNSRVIQAFGGDENWQGAGRDAYEERKQRWETAQQKAEGVVRNFERTAQDIHERYRTQEANVESMWAG